MPDAIGTLYAARLPLLKELCERLRQETEDALNGLPHVDHISFRVKDTGSFFAKATDPHNDPPYSEPLVEIEDQVAGRIIVFFRKDIQLVEERLAGTFHTVERTHRQPDRDVEFGYETRHFIFSIQSHMTPAGWTGRNDVPTTFEMQVRTIMMHAYAEPQHNIQYKAATELPPEIRRELAWIAASAWGADHAYERVMEWHTRSDTSSGSG